MKKIILFLTTIITTSLSFGQSVTGTGTLNRISKWSGTGSQTNSLLMDQNNDIIYQVATYGSGTIGDESKYIFNTSGTNGAGIGAKKITANTADLIMYAQYGYNNSTEIARFTSTGRFGIGVVSPTASLDINSPSIVGAETVLKLKVSDAGQDYIRIANATNSDLQFIPTVNGYHVSDNRASMYLTATTETNMDNGTEPLMVFDSRTTSASIVTRPLFSWDSYGNKKMILTSNGSLGIGTTTTGTHKLAVEGSIGAREIKVQATGWSDFVFKKSYNLPTLKEVEKHINEKGYLKDIPSEEEVLKNGINLGEMNSKLLQKIEELTLYTIEQQKNTEKLTKVIEILTKRLEVVERK